MARNRNSDIYGQPFARTTFGQVWLKGRVIAGFDPNLWRHDVRGSVMKFPDYGNTASQFGWEVDHVRPVAKGGGDELSNLQPLQWENNRAKSDTYPWP